MGGGLPKLTFKSKSFKMRAEGGGKLGNAMQKKRFFYVKSSLVISSYFESSKKHIHKTTLLTSQVTEGDILQGILQKQLHIWRSNQGLKLL